MKFEDLEVGMLVKDGLITELYVAGTDDKRDHYWSGNNAVTFFMIEDAYIGQGTIQSDSEREYTEVHKRGTNGYKMTVMKMANHRNLAAIDAAKDVDTLYGFILPDGKEG